MEIMHFHSRCKLPLSDLDVLNFLVRVVRECNMNWHHFGIVNARLTWKVITCAKTLSRHTVKQLKWFLWDKYRSDNLNVKKKTPTQTGKKHQHKPHFFFGNYISKWLKVHKTWSVSFLPIPKVKFRIPFRVQFSYFIPNQKYANYIS